MLSRVVKILGVLCLFTLLISNIATSNNKVDKLNSNKNLSEEIHKLLEEVHSLRLENHKLKEELKYYTTPKRIRLWYYCDPTTAHICYSAYDYLREVAKIYSNYISPDNIVVRNFARNVTLVKVSKIQYYLYYTNGSLVVFHAVSDQQQFHRPDYPQNPDYFLTHGMRGDCEDIAICVVSLLQAKGYNASLVLGYKLGKCHAWVELRLNGTLYVGDIFGFNKTLTFFFERADCVYTHPSMYTPVVRIS